jgi:hypothetical protein
LVARVSLHEDRYLSDDLERKHLARLAGRISRTYCNAYCMQGRLYPTNRPRSDCPFSAVLVAALGIAGAVHAAARPAWKRTRLRRAEWLRRTAEASRQQEVDARLRTAR